MVWFPEGPGADRFDEIIFKGPLARMTREALDYVSRNHLHETAIKHPDRAEVTRVWNFPYPAIEEALVNAVYHRSYEEREPIEVRISRDELTVLSFPGPDRSIRLSDFATGRAVSRRYRNRRIGEFFRELELTEGRSTGIPKILKVMAANGSPAPLFETDEDRIAFVVRLPVHPLTEQPRMPAIGQVTTEVTTEVGRVVMALQGELSRRELQHALSLKNDEHFRKAYLHTALDSGLVEMTFPDKPRSSKQRYRLSATGTQWLLNKNAGVSGV